MSDTVTTLHYGTESFILDLEADADAVEDLTIGINMAIQDGGRFVTVPTNDRGEPRELHILFSPGVPVWITTVSKRPAKVREATVL
ncbi:MAG TPA: hypothetical protein VF557_13310 [Jatrophihabitans sp.]|jgi:hypothetical protein|uniref:hypothetical protein n=1 Tax=Jatrophihabitans sp. TaxID=1932789 RepID=UPI002F1D64FC